MYEKVKALGEGTFLATENGRLYVLKEITPADCDVYRRLTAVICPYAARVLDTVLIENTFYAVREYVQGITVAQRVRQYGLFNETETRRIAAMVAAGLQAIHRCGVVHRDITPNNIILTNIGEAKIIDFGISRLEKENCSRDTQILGTQGYAAPEQFGFSQTTPRSDIYSLGAVMNFMLTGCLPSEGLYQGKMKPIIKQCLALDESQRYQTAEDLRIVLGESGFIKTAAYTLFRQNIGKNGQATVFRTLALAVYYGIVAIIIGLATTIGETFSESLSATLCFTFMFGVSMFFAADVFRWSKRLKPFAKLTPLKRAVLRVVLTLVSFFSSFLFVIVIE